MVTLSISSFSVPIYSSSSCMSLVPLEADRSCTIGTEGDNMEMPSGLLLLQKHMKMKQSNYLDCLKLVIQGPCQLQYHSTRHGWISCSYKHPPVPLRCKEFWVVVAGEYQMAFCRGVESTDNIWKGLISIRRVSLKGIFFNFPTSL